MFHEKYICYLSGKQLVKKLWTYLASLKFSFWLLASKDTFARLWYYHRLDDAWRYKLKCELYGWCRRDDQCEEEFGRRWPKKLQDVDSTEQINPLRGRESFWKHGDHLSYWSWSSSRRILVFSLSAMHLLLLQLLSFYVQYYRKLSIHQRLTTDVHTLWEL